jgi:sortase A
MKNHQATAPSTQTDHEHHTARAIRQKLKNIYQREPSANSEIKLSSITPKSELSRHQKYVLELQKSGMSLEDIQLSWHQYYSGLPDEQKREVWKEFYEHNRAPRTVKPDRIDQSEYDQPKTEAQLKKELLSNRRLANRRRRANLRSLAFGLSMGSMAVLIALFGFFNERFIAPFITPNKQVSSNSIIIDPSSTAVGTEPTLVIPKINVEVPVVYDEPSTEEKAVQAALERGVVHYANTPKPGEQGNGVIVGHSSSNILNRGKHKFAFVLLRSLDEGDTFYIQFNSKRYAYRIFQKRVVKPSEVSVLYNNEKPSSFTLITCDPPGTSLNRLVIVGEQISPNPSTNTASSAAPSEGSPGVLPSNAPTLWSRLTNWLFD